MDDNAKDLDKRASRLFERKAPLDSLNQTIAEQFYPERADFTSEACLGEEFATHLYDGSPVLMRRDLGNAFAAMLRPRGQPWFKIAVDESLTKEPGVKEWLDNATSILRRVLYAKGTQFVRATKETDHDFASFGNGVLSLEENHRRDGLVCRNWHLRDCAWVENADGEVDTLFRDMKMSARQMEQKFGRDALHRNVQKACDKDPDREFKVRHAMLPTEDYEYARKGRQKRLPFASVYIDAEHHTVLREAGAHEFRYVVPRWQTISGSPYAVSPAAVVALSDARMLQTMARVIMEAGEKSVDPPMKMTSEAVLSDVNLYAGGVTWVDKSYDEKTGAAIEPILPGRNPQLGLELLVRVGMQMREAWFLNKLTLPAQAKTAYETAQLVEEFIRAAIPLFEPMETEYNVPVLDAACTILIRNGVLGRPEELPEAIRGQDLEFKFSNPLQDAIERNKQNQATAIIGLAAGVMQIDQAAVKRLNMGEMLADASRGTGAPAEWLTEKEVAADAVAQEQQGSQVLMALHGADKAADVVNKGADAATKLMGIAGGAPGMAEAA